MDPCVLPLDLSSIEALQSSLKDLEDNMPNADNRVLLHHGPNSVAITIRGKPNGLNGAIKSYKTLVDLVREDWKPLESPFNPHPLLRSGHLQTLMAAKVLVTDTTRVYYARKLLNMLDGGTVGLDVVLDSEAHFKKGMPVDATTEQRVDYVKTLPSGIRYMQTMEEHQLLASDDNRPMLIALHGLSGGSHESYVQAIMHEITHRPSSRWVACCLNARGCGRTNITTQQLFCANWTGISFTEYAHCR
jgi:predicted alpha/beta-fold hydrolase